MKVLESSALWRLLGPKRDEVRGEWRTLHIEKHYDLYYSPNFIRFIKSRRIRWAERVARMGEKRCAYMVLVRIPEGKRPLDDLEVDGGIILNWIFTKVGWGV